MVGHARLAGTLSARRMGTPTTPAELARQLGISDRIVRAFLRAQLGKLIAPDTRWQLNEVRASEVRAHFSARR